MALARARSATACVTGPGTTTARSISRMCAGPCSTGGWTKEKYG